MLCPVCEFEFDSYSSLSAHLLKKSELNDVEHIMWLNRNITQEKVESKRALEEMIANFLETNDLKTWIKRTFINRFYKDKVHPFVLAMQKPSKAVLLGYVLEHQHFLRQWVRTLAFIVARTDNDEVVRYEMENMNTEFLGYNDKPSHYELLIRMGESLGMKREEILSTPPLPSTKSCLEFWRNIGERRHWVETMAAMHSLELVASKDLVKEGAKMHYFNVEILNSNDYPKEVKDFLREGYEADIYHAGEALELIEKHAKRLGLVEKVKVTFLKSMDVFDKYLMSRLERAILLDKSVSKVIEDSW